MKRWITMVLILVLATVLAACGNGTDTGNENDAPVDDDTSSEEDTEESNATSEEEVLVSLENLDGEVVGTATLTQTDYGVDIKLEGENLPTGTHGFHIHEVGKCDPPDFESAGSHYNPTNAEHGFEHPDGPHAGDLENIEVADDGTVTIEMTADMVTLEKDAENTLYTEEGTSLMIHSDADDYTSQPAGDAGDRIACGVIGE